MIFDESTLRKLNQITLVATRIRSGAIKGERRSSRRGSSVEFADYRDYTPGDDLRRLDWNIYARLNRPFIKLFEEEEDLAVYILVDGSRSMDWGESEQHKFQYAIKLAAGLGAIALASGDMLSAGILQNGKVTAEYGPTRGQGLLPHFFGFLEDLEPGGETDLNTALNNYSIKPRRPGLIILISDLLTPGGFETGLRPLLGRGHEAALLHLLSPDELDPPLTGDLHLVDIETKHGRDVSIDGGLRQAYRQHVQDWLHETQSECRQRGIHYLELNTGRSWEQALLLEMRRGGIVK